MAYLDGVKSRNVPEQTSHVFMKGTIYEAKSVFVPENKLTRKKTGNRAYKNY